MAEDNEKVPRYTFMRNQFTEFRAYGIAWPFSGFTYLCFGKKALRLRIQWSQVKRRVCVYRRVVDSVGIATNLLNGSRKWNFLGIIKIKEEDYWMHIPDVPDAI